MADNPEQQRIADIFNSAIAEHKVNNKVPTDKGIKELHADKRRGAMYALKRFEAASWYPEALDMALAEQPTVVLSFANNYVKGNLDEIREVFECYIEIVEEKTGAPAVENEYFSARHAAWYVARQLTRRGTPMSFAGIDKHIRFKKDLRGKILGTSMMFTRQTLDDYVDNFGELPKRGRPAAKPVEG